MFYDVGFGMGVENGVERVVDDDDGDIVVEGVLCYILWFDWFFVLLIVDEFYDVWECMVKDFVLWDVFIYSNFWYAFGDESECGERYREKEMKDIGNLLFKYKVDKKFG